MIKEYLESYNKRIIQEITLRSRQSKIVALGGPNIRQYVSILRKMGFDDITVLENNREIYQMQLQQHPQCKLIHGNILDHLWHDCFYDLDFCCSIRKIEPYLSQIVKLPEYSLTVSIRPVGYEETIETFKKYGDAYVTKYSDTVPMLTFFNNKTIKGDRKNGILYKKTAKYSFC